MIRSRNTLSLNRNILECKLKNLPRPTKRADGLNRNILECKYDLGGLKWEEYHSLNRNILECKLCLSAQGGHLCSPS